MFLADRILIQSYESAGSEKRRPALPMWALARFGAIALVFVGCLFWAYHAGKSSQAVAPITGSPGSRVISATTRLTDGWQVVWQAHGTGDGAAEGPLPDGALITWNCQGNGVGAGYLALREGDGTDLADWPGVSGTCPMSGSGRPARTHAPTLDLRVTADAAWTIAVEVWVG